MHFPKRNFDLITLGQMLLRLSSPGNERLARSDVFEKNVGGADKRRHKQNLLPKHNSRWLPIVMTEKAVQNE